MENRFPPDLVKITEIFLVPSSFLVAALGTADTNLHRALVSLLGLIISGLWCACSHEAVAEHPLDNRRTRILARLPLVFLFGWTTSMCIHLMLWNRPL